MIRTACKGCGAEFPSKNAVFRHLTETGAACLSEADYQDFLKYAVQQKREKVVILYGYWIRPTNIDTKGDAAAAADVGKETVLSIRNGEDVAQILLDVMEHLGGGGSLASPPTNHGDDTTTTTQKQQATSTTVTAATAGKVNRSYGHISRSDIVAQEDGTSAITEVLATRLPPLAGTAALGQWMQQVNDALLNRCNSSDSSTTKDAVITTIRVLGRQPMPISKFNAEIDVSHRRVEYLLPADFLMSPGFFAGLPSFTDGVRSRNFNKDNDNDDETAVTPVIVEDSTTHLLPFCRRPSEETLALLTSYKKKMQSLTTHIVDLDTSDAAAVFEKQFHDQKRQRNRAYHNNKNDSDKNEDRQQDTECDGRPSTDAHVEDGATTLNDVDRSEGDKCCAKGRHNQQAERKREKSSKKKRTVGDSKKKGKVLRRKRYHNFTPTVMAHEFLSYRRLDRFYHRATLRFGCDCRCNGPKLPIDEPRNLYRDEKWKQEQMNRPFLALSMSGDMFLTGQACRVVGLFIALARGVVDDDFVECVFDEKYPHLVLTPAAPTFAMYAGSVFYISIEGKAKAILTPRKTDRYENGWNDEGTIQSVRDWQAIVRENAARVWVDQGVDEDGRLIAEKLWTETVLYPWAVRARKQLKDYRCWKRAASTGNVSNAAGSSTGTTVLVAEPLSDALSNPALPPIGIIDPKVPLLFEKVLYYLRKADASGLWPSTTPKRQLVMISNVSAEGTDNETGGAVSAKPLTSSLSIAHMKAKSNTEERSSAYVFVEGQGGASGSFSLGAMPGDKCIQPKGNTLFPELMNAAFELEVALCPDREPSSTIAVNRNAQFRPHTDSGAGAGQSRSLIVGLGTYCGGELVVEGEMMDIRYKAVEFDGWKQRHWTMPFQGERYSLVWFTPKGCEGINFVR
jgi:hypothetical protein